MIQLPQMPLFRDPDTSDASFVAGWHFPSTRGTPHDILGAHDGVPTDMTFLKTAGDYNGTTSVIHVADHADLDITDNLTVRGWFRNTAGEGTLVSKYESGDRSWYVRTLTDGGISVVVSDDGQYTDHVKSYSTSAIPFTATWRQFGFTFATGALKLYVDGAEAAVTKTVDNAITSINAGTDDVLIGARSPSSPTAFFTGDLACVGMWNEVKSAAWYAQDYRNTLPDPSCVLMTTDGLADLSAYGRTLTNNGLQRGTAGITCDGTGYVSAADAAALKITDNQTFAYWIKTTDANGAVAIRWDDATNRCYYLEIASGKAAFRFSDDGTTDAGHQKTGRGAIDVDDGDWHYVVTRFAAGVVSLFVDAVQDEITIIAAADITAIYAGTSGLQFGKFLVADIRFVGVYNEIKSPAWVAQQHALLSQQF